MKTLVLVVAMGLLGCKRAQPEQVSMTPMPTGSAGVGGAPAVSSDAVILAAVPPAVGYRYFATKGGNHPALFLDPARDAFVVIGRAASLGETAAPEQVFPRTKLDDAIVAYEAQLVAVGYLPEGVPPPPPRDPNALVVMNLDDLLGSGEPSDDAGQVLYRTRPTDAWVAFAAHRAPALAAGGSELNVIGPTGLTTHSWAESRKAIAAFRALVK